MSVYGPQSNSTVIVFALTLSIIWRIKRTPPPPPRHVEASPATLALVQAENERLRRRVAELDAPVGRENEKLREALAKAKRRGGELEAADVARQKRIETLERAAAESTDEIARLTARVAMSRARDYTARRRRGQTREG